MAATLQARPLLIHGLADTNVHLQNTVNFIEALEANDKLFDFIPLAEPGPQLQRRRPGGRADGQRRLSHKLSDRRAYDRDAGASGAPTRAGRSRACSDARDAGSRG